MKVYFVLEEFKTSEREQKHGISAKVYSSFADAYDERDTLVYLAKQHFPEISSYKPSFVCGRRYELKGEGDYFYKATIVEREVA